MYTRYLLFVLALAVAATAQAQVDYFTVASASDLLDGGTLADIEIDCMDRDPASGDFFFYNEATGDLVRYDPDATAGSRTTIIRSNAQLDADFGADVVDCRAMAIADGVVYAALAITGNIDSVYRTDLGGTSASILGTADGIGGLDVDGSTVYLGMVQFFGAPEDGFYSMNTTGTGQTPAALATDAALDLYDVQFRDGALWSSSSEFGGTGFQNVVVSHVLGSGTITTLTDPFADGTFTNGTDGGLEDLEAGTVSSGGLQLYLFNNSFSATDGEQWAYTDDGATFDRFAEQAPMLADPDVTISGYDAPDGTHMVYDGSTNTLYVGSISAFGGEDAIIGMTDVPIPVELTAFEATVDGGAVHLTWATASETNNAGFEVQMRLAAGTDYAALGFVEGHGTTTEARSYAFTTDALAPGAYAFRLKQVDFDGQTTHYGDVEVTVGTPGTHLLSSVYPNPFNPSARFDLAVAQAQRVRIALYNALGQRVAVVFDGPVAADAAQTFTLDGAGLPTGTYVLRVAGERFTETRAATLVK